MRARPNIPEFRLLCACLRWPEAAVAAEAIRAASAGEIDWRRFVQMVAWHRVGGIVHRALAHADVAIPPPATVALYRLARRNAAASLQRLAVSSQIAALFRGAAFPFFFLKGEALGIQIYGAPGVRHSIDVDVFVPPSKVDVALTLLTQAGYVRELPHAGASARRMTAWLRTQKDLMLRTPLGVTVELHWRILENRNLLADVATTQTIEIEIARGLSLPRLPPNVQFIYLCAHGAYHGWFRLKWLADIGALLSQLSAADIATLRRDAKVAGITRCVDQALLLSARLLGTGLPDSLISELEADWQIRLLADLAIRIMIAGGEIGDPASQMKRELLSGPSRWLMGDGFGYVATEFRRLLTNPRDLLTSDVPDWLLRFSLVVRLPYWIWKRRPGAARRIALAD